MGVASVRCRAARSPPPRERSCLVLLCGRDKPTAGGVECTRLARTQPKKNPQSLRLAGQVH